jgi:drug/metabolite transporter (DMT)-like permease
MPLSAFALALGAAFLHALWNLLLARARDPEAAAAVALAVAVVAFAPVAAVAWEADAAVWPYVLASAVLELAYFVLLGAAYRRAELSVVYPLARGLAPVLVLLVGIAALGVGSSAAQAAGVALVGLGVLLVRGIGRRQPDPAGVFFGAAIACCIAGYTLVDNSGIEHAAALAYLELTMVAPAIAYGAGILAWKGFPAVRAELGGATVAAGLATFGAYGLVLLALERAAAAPVAAVRETSVVLAAGGAAFVLGERVGPQRLAGAALVAGGVALVSS